MVRVAVFRFDAAEVEEEEHVVVAKQLHGIRERQGVGARQGRFRSSGIAAIYVSSVAPISSDCKV